jgi:hypothetical protein
MAKKVIPPKSTKPSPAVKMPKKAPKKGAITLDPRNA